MEFDGTKYRIISKKLIFGQSYKKFTAVMVMPKMMDIVDISKFLQKMNEQILKVYDP